MTQRLHVGVTDVSPTRTRVVVISCSFEYQPLVNITILYMKKFLQKPIAMSHLVTSDIVKTLLRICIRVVAVLVGIT